MTLSGLRFALGFGLMVLAPALTSASGRYDPRLRFQTISTTRFDIHYHQGEEPQARRLARLAETVAAELDATLGRPSGRVQVILVDQSDLSNGWATPLPFNTIEIAVASPAGSSLIGNTDDWLRLVFVHEYTHVVHLSRGRGWIGGLRRVFGRMPLLYPNLYLPLWQIEGIAVHEESALTGQGRVPDRTFAPSPTSRRRSPGLSRSIARTAVLSTGHQARRSTSMGPTFTSSWSLDTARRRCGS